MRLVNAVILFALLFGNTVMFAQHEDCDLAQVICDNGPISFNSEGTGTNDFLDPGNHPGCLLTNENQTAWYYFEFTPDMPANSIIEFTIEPNGGFTEDYDFAIYGPNVPCDGLGFPVRCSFANFECDLCPLTGLGMGATDTSEGAQNEDGFVAPMTVQPGEGYYMVLDNWYGSSDGFTLTWGGSAADYLNCLANPACNDLSVNAGVDLSLCAGDSLDLNATLSNASGAATVVWTATADAHFWLDDSTALQPAFYPPADFAGAVTFTVTVMDGECEKSDQVIITVDALPEVSIAGDSLHCPNTTTTLEVSESFTSYLWSNDSTTQQIEIDTAGQYWLQATANNGCIGADTLIITEVEVALPVIQGNDQICVGDSTTLSVSSPFATYLWDGGSADSSITVFAAGDYAVVVTDSNGCSTEAAFTVDVLPLPQPMISGDDVICEGDTALINASPGFAGYLWSIGAETPEIGVQSEGSYSVTVTDAAGCSGEADFDLMVNDAPIPSMLIGPPFCPGDSTPIRVNVGYASYEWSDGGNLNVTYALEAGTYTVTVTDNNGCQGVGSKVAETYDLPTPNIVGDTVFCVGDVSTLNAESNYEAYLWSDGTTSSSLMVNNPGSISLTVTDENGCQGMDEVEVVVNPLPVFSLNGDLSYCENDSTTLTVENGFANYLWSDGSQDTALVVNGPGTYSLTVTDDNGCQDETSVLVIEHPVPTPQITGALNFCPDESTTLGLSTAFAAYEWSGGEDAPSLQINTPGTYSVTVTDDNSCQGIATETVIPFPEVNLQILGDTAFCAGESSLLSTDANYATYQWSDNTTLPMLEVTTAGDYGLTVTDDNGCQDSVSMEITENQLPTPVIQGGNGFCADETLIMSTTAAWEEYQWSNGSSLQSIEVNTPGFFSVTVTDTNGCSGSTGQDVQAFSAPTVQLTGELTFCPGTSTTLSTTTDFASYLWSDNSGEPTLTVETPGMYSLTVTDVNGCSASVVESIAEYTVIAPEIDPVQGFCEGQSLVVDAGQYDNYLWSDNSSGPALEVNQPGDYSLTVVDFNGCAASAAFNVEAYSLPQPQLQGVEGLCPGESSTLSLTEPFADYQWSNGSEDETLLVDAPGMYSLTVTDENGCEAVVATNLLAYQNPDPEVQGETEICPGETTMLSLTESYASYEWSGGEISSVIEVPEPGIITVTVMNEEGCTEQTTVEVIGLPEPEFEIAGDTAFCAGGSALLSVPAQFASYQWSPSWAFPELQVTQAGDYTVTVTNEEGCAASRTIAIAEIALPTPDPGLNQTLDCDNLSVLLGGEQPLPADRYAYLWVGPGIDGTNEEMPRPEVDAEGLYTLVVEDELYGCFSEDLLIEVVDLSYEPDIAFASVEQLDCAVLNTPIDASASDNFPAIQYYWQGEDGTSFSNNTPVLTVGDGGWYYLELRDTSTGCWAVDSVFVEENRAYPEVQIEEPGLLNCYQSELMLDGSNSSTGSEYSYEWTGPGAAIQEGANGPMPVVNAPGWYILSVQNTANHCLAQDSVELLQDITPPVANAGGDLALDCVQLEVSLDASESSVGPNFRYHWTNETGVPLVEATAVTPLVNQPGGYYLTVTNLENGCTATDQVQITDEANYPNVTNVNVEHPDCFGEQTGQITVEAVEDGMPPFLYALDGAAFSNEGVFSSLEAGTYDLSVEDAEGCVTTVPIEVEAGSEIQVELGDNRQINLGEALEIAPSLIKPGIGHVRFDWELAGIDSCRNCPVFSSNLLETTTVQVIATDEQGCQDSDLVTIFVAQRDEVYIPNAFSPNEDGINDLFMVYAGADVALINRILVLDRWGNQLFEIKNIMPNDESKGWDGSFRSRKSSPGVYTYLVEVTFIDGDTKIFKGDVTVVK